MTKKPPLLPSRKSSIVWKLETTNTGSDELHTAFHLDRFVSRLVLRCRQLARARFSQMRSDVLVKLELLDQKHG